MSLMDARNNFQNNPDRSLIFEEETNQKNYVLSESYQSISTPESNQKGIPCLPGTETDRTFAASGQHFNKPMLGNEIPSLVEQIIAARNKSETQPIFQYNTYNIYTQSESIKPISFEHPQPHFDKIVLGFAIIFAVLFFGFGSIIYFLLRKIKKIKKTQKENEEKSILHKKIGLDESGSMSTSEINLIPQTKSLKFSKIDHSSLLINGKRKMSALSLDKNENWDQSKKSTKDEQTPTENIERTKSDGQERVFNIAEIHKELATIIKNDFSEKIINIVPELNKGHENSFSFINSPELPTYENGRFKNNFYSIKEIGKGSFGCVYRAFHKLEEKIYAVKKIEFEIRAGDDPRMSSTLREIYAMSDLKHDNVVRYITCWLEKNEKDDIRINGKHLDINFNFEKKSKEEHKKSIDENQPFYLEDIKPISMKRQSELEIDFLLIEKDLQKKNEMEESSEEDIEENVEHVNLFIQMDFCKGLSLSACLETNSFQLSRVDIFCIFSQIVDGIAYIHSKGLIHRDLKPGNIFVETSGIVKIGDFGLVLYYPNCPSVSIMESATSSQVQLKNKFEKTKNMTEDETEYAGTPLYIAPELINQQFEFNESGDIYAIGIILYELLNQFKTKHEKINEIVALKNSKRTKEAFKMQNHFEGKIIDLLINPDPNMRPKAKEIRGLKEYQDWNQYILKLVSQKKD